MGKKVKITLVNKFEKTFISQSTNITSIMEEIHHNLKDFNGIPLIIEIEGFLKPIIMREVRYVEDEKTYQWFINEFTTALKRNLKVKDVHNKNEFTLHNVSINELEDYIKDILKDKIIINKNFEKQEIPNNPEG